MSLRACEPTIPRPARTGARQAERGRAAHAGAAAAGGGGVSRDRSGVVRGSNAVGAVKLAFKFLVLMAARWGEVRGARCDEMDTSAHVWTRSGGAYEGETGSIGFRFAGVLWTSSTRRGPWATAPPRSCSRRATGRCSTRRCYADWPERQGVPAVPHGFRSSFRDWASERTNQLRRLWRAAPAHAVKDQTEAAYAWSDLFERRRTLMDDWGAYLAEGGRWSACGAGDARSAWGRSGPDAGSADRHRRPRPVTAVVPKRPDAGRAPGGAPPRRMQGRTLFERRRSLMGNWAPTSRRFGGTWFACIGDAGHGTTWIVAVEAAPC